MKRDSSTNRHYQEARRKPGRTPRRAFPCGAIARGAAARITKQNAGSRGRGELCSRFSLQQVPMKPDLLCRVGTARKARLCPPYHSIRAGRAVDAIGRADPNRSTFANHVLRSRCAGREYDGTSPRSTRFSVGTGSSWDAEYNLCVVQVVTSVQLVTSGPCNGTHV